jgi:hypothetical protein
MEEYKFDGYRFDGVTSMLYTHHGIGTYVHYPSEVCDALLVDGWPEVLVVPAGEATVPFS